MAGFLSLLFLQCCICASFLDWLSVCGLKCLLLVKWRRGVVVSGVGLINEVNRHCARLVLGCVTLCGRVNHLGM